MSQVSQFVHHVKSIKYEIDPNLHEEATPTCRVIKLQVASEDPMGNASTYELNLFTDDLELVIPEATERAKS